MSDHEDIMQQWDSWRKYIAEGGTASWPRDEFEMVIANYKERVKELENEKSYWNCPIHGQAQNAWGCPECVRELRESLKRLQEAVDGIKLIIDRQEDEQYCWEYAIDRIKEKLYKVREEG